jgi:hypothetical protein
MTTCALRANCGASSLDATVLRRHSTGHHSLEVLPC